MSSALPPIARANRSTTVPCIIPRASTDKRTGTISVTRTSLRLYRSSGPFTVVPIQNSPPSTAETHSDVRFRYSFHPTLNFTRASSRSTERTRCARRRAIPARTASPSTSDGRACPPVTRTGDSISGALFSRWTQGADHTWADPSATNLQDSSMATPTSPPGPQPLCLPRRATRNAGTPCSQK